MALARGNKDQPPRHYCSLWSGGVNCHLYLYSYRAREGLILFQWGFNYYDIDRDTARVILRGLLCDGVRELVLHGPNTPYGNAILVETSPEELREGPILLRLED